MHVNMLYVSPSSDLNTEKRVLRPLQLLMITAHELSLIILAYGSGDFQLYFVYFVSTLDPPSDVETKGLKVSMF